jgi:thiol-disulfide isomerase/thioredoxin
MQNPKRPLFQASLYLILIVAASSTFSCSNGNASEGGYAPPSPSPLAAKVNELKVRMVDGADTRFSDLIGNNKVVLVNFWATWCQPCRVEIPELIALQRDFKEKGVEVIGLTVEDPETIESVKAFAASADINYRIGFSSDEMFMIFNGDDPRGVIPQTFIFDRNGKLVDSLKGFRRDFRDRVEGALNHALNNS